MSVDYFIDTNIFIYQLEGLDAAKFDIANKLIRDGIATGRACISFQVVQECLNTVLRKAEIPLDTSGTQRYLKMVLTPLFRVPATISLYEQGLDIQMRYKYGLYDSLIITAALNAGCDTLYSEDLQHGQQIDGLVIKNPFC